MPHTPAAPNRSSHDSSKGFTLVELSIVIAIIGLIVGAVLAGQDMIRNTRVKNFAKDQEMIHTAVQQFYDKYGALPGDMPNATELWGAEDGTPAICIVTASTDKATCDGDGSGKIAATGETADYERFRLWQHLSNAELLEGKFNGTTDQPLTEFVPHAFDLSYSDTMSADARWFDGEYTHTLSLVGAAYPLTATEMSNIDSKFDDGFPALGNYLGQIIAPFNCTLKADLTANPASSDLDAVYNLRSDGGFCSFVRRNFIER